MQIHINKKKKQKDSSQDDQNVLCDDGILRPKWAAVNQLCRSYFDNEWGQKVTDDNLLFEKLCLEVFQTGLIWSTILRKRDELKREFMQFDLEKVAKFDEKQISNLMKNPSVIRHRKKIESCINNASVIISMRSGTPFNEIVWNYKTEKPESDQIASTKESTALFKELRSLGFEFIGPTMLYSFMQAVGIAAINKKQ